MRNFKLADNLHTFSLRQSYSSCSGQCDSHKRSSPGKNKKSPDYFDYMFKGTYLLCSCLIVYSLLVINFLSIDDPQNNLFSVTMRPLASVGQELAYNAMYVGEAMGNPLEYTIAIYSESLAWLFQSAGELLSKIPDMLTWAPSVRARTISNYYW